MKNSLVFKTQALDLVRCPQIDCGGGLELAPGGRAEGPGLRDGYVSCTECEALYPVLGGAGILVPDVPHWIGRHEESILACLAQHGAASSEAVEIVARFRSCAPDEEPMRFGDDWVPEETGEREPVRPLSGGPSSWRDLVDKTRRSGPDEVISELIGDTIGGVVAEIGCGAGTLTRRLAKKSKRLLVGDLSLRAVLTSARRALEAGAHPAAVVLDAEQLPLRPESFDTAVAANLVDLLDEPELFAADVHRALRTSGRLLLSSPRPQLLGQSDEELSSLLEREGFRIGKRRDAVPWLRAHDARYFEVYFAAVLEGLKT